MDQFKDREQLGQSKLNDDGSRKVLGAADQVRVKQRSFRFGQRIGDRYARK